MLKLTDSDITFSFWTLPYDYDSFRKKSFTVYTKHFTDLFHLSYLIYIFCLFTYIAIVVRC